MTVLLDSSVLVQAQRMPDSETALRLGELLASGEAVITGPVAMEYIQGALGPEELDTLTEWIVSLDSLDTGQMVWVTAGQLGTRLLRAGLPLPDADIIIAATAIRHDIPYTPSTKVSTAYLNSSYTNLLQPEPLKSCACDSKEPNQ